MKLDLSINKIDEVGGLLVFPIDNRPEPSSLWSRLYPKSEMRWEWDETGDTRVVKLWHLKTELSQCKKVVYSKWYKGRATFFSRSVFTAILAELAFPKASRLTLSEQARQILTILELDSPLSTKALKKEAGLKGRDNESIYQRSLKTLWERGLIVGYGEVDDGAFPSLAIGASQLLFDELWEEAKQLTVNKSKKILEKLFENQPLFKKEFEKIKKTLDRGVNPKSSKGILRGSDLFLTPK
jgi:hypothetical protein